MASHSLLHVLLFSYSLILSLSVPNTAQSQPNTLIFPLKKDNVTLQYLTSIDMGTDPIVSSMELVIDLGGQFLWFDCHGYGSSSYRPVRCGSSKCRAAKGSGCIGCNGPARPGCTNNTCGVFPYNPIRNLLEVDGFGEDVINVYYTDGISSLQNVNVPDFPLSCVSSSHLESLSNRSKGMAGFARTKTSLPVKLVLELKLSHKFALCIPSSAEFPHGVVFVGGGPYYMLPFGDVSKSLVTTPLIINPVSTATIYSEGDPSDEYFIGVESIKISGKVVTFNSSFLAIDKKGVGGTKFSTIAPYTILQSSIYNALINKFVIKAAIRKIKRVKSLAPFGACFSSKTIRSTRTGPEVPNIDLVLQGGVYWRIYGSNSMVKVNKDALCLGFIDGGAEPRTSTSWGGIS